MTTQTLSQRAMLATLNIRRWDATRTDKKVSREVADQHSVEQKRAGHYRKHVIDVNAPTYKAVATAAAEIRHRHYHWTLPWAQDGARILPFAHFEKYSWNRSAWIKDPDTGKRARRERPESEWIVNEGPALIDHNTWERVRGRLRERVHVYGGARGGQPRYLLSGLLVCQPCGSRLIISGQAGSHYYCGTHRHGGASACAMSLGVRRAVAEEVIIGPIRDELLSPAAITRAVQLIRQWHRQERARSAQAPSPELAKVDAAIADIEALIAQEPSRSEILGGALEAQRQRRATLQRQAWRQAASLGQDEEVPAERAYRAYVERMGELLDSKNVAGARDVLRGVLGEVRVRPDESGRHLVAQVGINPVPLLQAAGIAWVGSGGVLWTQARDLALVA